eukprot:5250674-Prymnesium_polylepis.2
MRQQTACTAVSPASQSHTHTDTQSRHHGNPARQVCAQHRARLCALGKHAPGLVHAASLAAGPGEIDRHQHIGLMVSAGDEGGGKSQSGDAAAA